MTWLALSAALFAIGGGPIVAAGAAIIAAGVAGAAGLAKLEQ